MKPRREQLTDDELLRRHIEVKLQYEACNRTDTPEYRKICEAINWILNKKNNPESEKN